MAYRLLQRLQKQGVGVHDRSAVETIEPTSRGVTVHLRDGHRLRARRVVMAAGYASQSWLKQRVAANRSRYACVTDGSMVTYWEGGGHARMGIGAAISVPAHDRRRPAAARWRGRHHRRACT